MYFLFLVQSDVARRAWLSSHGCSSLVSSLSIRGLLFFANWKFGFSRKSPSSANDIVIARKGNNLYLLFKSFSRFISLQKACIKIFRKRHELNKYLSPSMLEQRKTSVGKNYSNFGRQSHIRASIARKSAMPVKKWIFFYFIQYILK